MKNNTPIWVTEGFKSFSRGKFVNGGDNLYVNAKGIIENIHGFDVNGDGYVDIILPNNHGYIERGPTWIYKHNAGGWEKVELPNDSGWISKIADVDGDGYQDLIVVNGENGVTSELDSYIYWGGRGGLTGDVTKLPTKGAYDVALCDINNDGLLDLVFSSAWADHHNPGRENLMDVYLQINPRQFINAKEKYNLMGHATVSIACDDLNKDGFTDIVLANYRKEFEYSTVSYVYWGSEKGYSSMSRLELPTNYALQVVLEDLNKDGYKEIVFCGGDEVCIYWNRNGSFSKDNRDVIKTKGLYTIFSIGAVRADIADVDNDGNNELILATEKGIEIRSPKDLYKVKTFLELKNSSWVKAYDLNNDGYKEIIASKYHNDITYETDSAIFWNCKDGFDRNSVTFLPTAGAIGCTAGDIDGDGKPEVIFNSTLQGYTQTYSNFPAYVYLGNKKHQYTDKRCLELPNAGGGGTYVLADLNLDGYPDLVLTSPEGARIFWGGPDGPKPSNYTVLAKPAAESTAPCGNVYVADFNRDGWLDLLLAGYTYDSKKQTMKNSSFIFYGSSDGFSNERIESIPTYCMANIHLADINNDGWLDIVYGDRRGYLVVYLGGPKGYSLTRTLKILLEDTVFSFIDNINSADLNDDGWLDLIVCVEGHYLRKHSGFYILYGGPDGFLPEKIEFHQTEASATSVSIADINNDGNLDLLVASYSTQFSRELPALIYFGSNGKTFDFDNPLKIPCQASCAFTPIDINGNGYSDIIVVNHRNDLGHKVDSLIFFNGPGGLDLDNPLPLPGMGPHAMTTRDPGNRKDRKPIEYYESQIKDIKNKIPVTLSWKGKTPPNTELGFQLRWGLTKNDIIKNKWRGPSGENSCYCKTGEKIRDVPKNVNYLQYRVLFKSTNGCFSPELSEVTIEFS